MKGDKLRKRTCLILLLLVTVLAAGVRVTGLGYDRLICFNHDEQIHLLTAQKIYRGTLNPRLIWEGRKFLYVFYPWLSMYIVAAVYFLSDIIRSVYFLVLSRLICLSGYRGAINEAFSHFQPGWSERGALYLGRLTIALIGAANIPLVYAIGKKLWDCRTALLAAALLALNGYHVANCHWMKNDIIATFFLSAAFFFAVRIFLRGRTIDYLLGGGFSALALTAKFNTMPFLAVCLFAHLGQSAAGNRRSLIWRCLDRKILVFALVFLIVFVATYPLLYLDLNYIISNIKPLVNSTEKQAMFAGLGSQARPRNFFQIRRDNLINLARFSWEMEAGLGGLVLLLGLGGILLAGFTRNRRFLLTASFPVIYVISAALVASPGVRYQDIIPLFPFFALLSAGFVRWIFQAVFRKNWLVTAIMIPGSILLLLPYARMVARMDYGYWERSVRYFASRWAARNIPPGSAVIRESKTLALDEGSYRSARVRALWNRQVEKLKEAGVDYLVVASRHEQRALEKTGLFGPDHPYGKFYLSLPSEYDLIKEFDLGVIPYRGGGSKIWQLRRERPFCPEGLNSAFLRRLQNDFSLESAEILFLDRRGRCEGGTTLIAAPARRLTRLLISPVSLSRIGVQVVNGFQPGLIGVGSGGKKVKEKFASGEARQFVFPAKAGFPYIGHSYRVGFSSGRNSPCRIRIQPDPLRIGLGYLELGDSEKALSYLVEAAALDPRDWYPRYLLSRVYGSRGDDGNAALYRREMKKIFPECVSAIADLCDDRSSDRIWKEKFEQWTGYSASWIAERAGYIWDRNELREVREEGGGHRLEKPGIYLPAGEYSLRLFYENERKEEKLTAVTLELARGGKPFKKWAGGGESPLPEMSFSNPEFGPDFTLAIDGERESLSDIRKVSLQPAIPFLRSRVTAYLHEGEKIGKDGTK